MSEWEVHLLGDSKCVQTNAFSEHGLEIGGGVPDVFIRHNLTYFFFQDINIICCVRLAVLDHVNRTSRRGLPLWVQDEMPTAGTSKAMVSFLPGDINSP